MNKLVIVIALAMAVLTAGPAVASEKTDVMATMHQLDNAFTNGDTKNMLAATTDQMSIIDGFPPYEWHGAGALSKYITDFDAFAKKNGITDPVFSTGKPLHVDVTGDRAYVVVPATYTYKQNGKPVKETGFSTITFQKVEAGWRVTGFAWAKH